jgi:hypothetical protein
MVTFTPANPALATEAQSQITKLTTTIENLRIEIDTVFKRNHPFTQELIQAIIAMDVPRARIRRSILLLLPRLWGF